MEIQLPLQKLYHWEKNQPNDIYMRQPINGEWKEWTWHETAMEVRKMAAYLKSLNLPEQSNIAIVSKNCAHWIISDLAIMMAGHVSVPLYPNLNAETLQKILEHSESKVLFVGKLDDWKSMKSGVPEGINCISFPFYPHEEYLQWYEIIKGVSPILEDIQRDSDELATIMYTSGTTGMPKGVMHRFYNFGFAATYALNEVNISTKDKFFSYLPLCHIAERLLVEMGGLYSGGNVSFAESIDTFQDNLADTQPTVFLGVPRIWTKFQQGVLTKMSQKKLSIILNIPFISSLVKNKIKTALGLKNAQNIFTGAAPTPTALINWYKSLGINIQEAYAMTENCCYSHVTLNDNIKVGYVGKALPKCEVKLSEEKEVLIKHNAIMQGYYKERELTNQTITDGWLHTGDEGEIDSEGFLKITGRVKDLFKTSKGKYVAPSPIEMKVSINKDIEQVCVVGDGVPQTMALIVLSEQGLQKSNSEIESSLLNTMNIVNPKLDPHETMRKMIIIQDPWTVENELLTPTMKVKRKKVEKIFVEKYVKWYEDEEEVIWQ